MQLRKVDQQNALQILRKLDLFESTGIGDIKRLVNVHPPELRLRHGNYRVRFYATPEAIEVLSISNRDKSYA